MRRTRSTIAMRDGIIDAIREFRADPAVRAVLITGEGDSFCAGMDLSASTVTQAGRPGFVPRTTSEALRVGVQTFIRELWELDKPTIAAVNGAAVGPGAHLALACDFVFVHPRTRFIWTFAKWGLVADAGGAYLLPRLVGLPRAKAMVMLGEGATGAEAVDMGLAYRCVDSPEALMPDALELTRRLAAGPTRSLGLSKRLLNASFETDLARLTRVGRPLPDARHGITRPRRGHGRVPREARRALRRHLSEPPRHGTPATGGRLQRLRRRRIATVDVQTQRHHRTSRLVDVAGWRARLRRAPGSGGAARARRGDRPHRPDRRTARRRLAPTGGASTFRSRSRLPQRAHCVPHRDHRRGAAPRDEGEHGSGRVVHAPKISAALQLVELGHIGVSLAFGAAPSRPQEQP